MKKIEETNTIVFIVNIRSNKHQIAEAIQKLYGVKAAKVNTLIRYVPFLLFFNISPVFLDSSLISNFCEIDPKFTLAQP